MIVSSYDFIATFGGENEESFVLSLDEEIVTHSGSTYTRTIVIKLKATAKASKISATYAGADGAHTRVENIFNQVIRPSSSDSTS